MTSNHRMLRVFVDESRHHGGLTDFEQVVSLARDRGLAGATVLRGVAGFGHTRTIHTSKVLQVSEHVPMVIEVVDESAKIEAFAAEVRSRFPEALITILEIQVWP